MWRGYSYVTVSRKNSHFVLELTASHHKLIIFYQDYTSLSLFLIRKILIHKHTVLIIIKHFKKYLKKRINTLHFFLLGGCVHFQKSSKKEFQKGVVLSASNQPITFGILDYKKKTQITTAKSYIITEHLCLTKH